MRNFEKKKRPKLSKNEKDLKRVTSKCECENVQNTGFVY